MTLNGPAVALTEHTALPAAFGGDMVESTKSSEPCSTPGVPEALDPMHTHSLHQRLGPFVATNSGNTRGRDGKR